MIEVPIEAMAISVAEADKVTEADWMDWTRIEVVFDTKLARIKNK